MLFDYIHYILEKVNGQIDKKLKSELNTITQIYMRMVETESKEIAPASPKPINHETEIVEIHEKTLSILDWAKNLDDIKRQVQMFADERMSYIEKL